MPLLKFVRIYLIVKLVTPFLGASAQLPVVVHFFFLRFTSFIAQTIAMIWAIIAMNLTVVTKICSWLTSKSPPQNTAANTH